MDSVILDLRALAFLYVNIFNRQPSRIITAMSVIHVDAGCRRFYHRIFSTCRWNRASVRLDVERWRRNLCHRCSIYNSYLRRCVSMPGGHGVQDCSSVGISWCLFL